MSKKSRPAKLEPYRDQERSGAFVIIRSIRITLRQMRRPERHVAGLFCLPYPRLKPQSEVERIDALLQLPDIERVKRFLDEELV